MAQKRIDWVKYTKEYISGPFKSIREYIDWNTKRIEEFNEVDRPRKDAITRAARSMKWNNLKKRKANKLLSAVFDGKVDEATTEHIKELITQKTALTTAMLNLIKHFAENPEKIHMKADLSDLVNDFKRTVGGMVTKEQEQKAPSLTLNNPQVTIDSRRKALEEGRMLNKSHIDKQDRINISIRKQLYPTDEAAEATHVDAIVEDIEKGEEDDGTDTSVPGATDSAGGSGGDDPVDSGPAEEGADNEEGGS